MFQELQSTAVGHGGWPEKYQDWDCRTESSYPETKSRNWQCEETGKLC